MKTIALTLLLAAGCGGTITPQETAAVVDTGLLLCQRALKQNAAAVQEVVRRDPRLAGGPIGDLCADPLVRDLLLGGLDLLLAGAAQPTAAAPQPVPCAIVPVEDVAGGENPATPPEMQGGAGQ